VKSKLNSIDASIALLLAKSALVGIECELAIVSMVDERASDMTEGDWV